MKAANYNKAKFCQFVRVAGAYYARFGGFHAAKVVKLGTTWTARLVKLSDNNERDADGNRVYAETIVAAQDGFASMAAAQQFIHETTAKITVTATNMMSGKEFQESIRTPYYCSPASETYWSA